MAEQMEKNGLEIVELCARMELLEKRVAALESVGTGTEKGVGARPRPVRAGESGTTENSLGVKHKDKIESRTGGPGIVPVFGKSVLALAGAYLLRAAAESGSVPRWLMLVAGIAYASGWLVWAAKTEKRNHFASVVYALTVAAILAPLLWEGTARFGDLSAGITATVLVGYVVLSLALEWKEKAAAIPWIAVGVATVTVLALIIATHELSALTAGMLAIALTAEVASWSGRWPAMRTVTGFGALTAVAVIGMVMTSGDGAPASYRAMSAGEIAVLCAGMAAVFGGSFVVRGFGLRRRWTVTEIAVDAAAVALGAWVSVRATQGRAGEFWGVVFLAMAGVCYWGALKRFSGETEAAERRWNRRVSANFAAALLLAGNWLLLNKELQVALLSVAAIVAVLVFTRTGYLSLGIHGTAYLLAAGAVCGLFGYAGRALAGTVPAWPQWSFWLVAAAGLVSYIVGTRASGNEWKARVLWVVPAAVVGFVIAAVVVGGVVSLTASGLSASRLSMVRTVVTCGMALGMAYGSHWKRAELGWVAYGAIGLGALKLVLEDLRLGNAGTLVVSLLAYGAILVMLPRVMRTKEAVGN